MFYFDPLYFVFALPALLLAFYAQIKIKSAYNKYGRIRNARGVTGLEAARRLLAANYLSHVKIQGVPGELSDHYDPRTETLRLSSGVARTESVAALAVAAHEIGHAMQHAQGYGPLRVRSGLVPIVNFGSYLGPILFIVGMLLNLTPLAWLGVFAFAGAFVFALVTLPVELNASRRALKALQENGLVLGGDDLRGAKSVLSAAAWTYVAALAQALSTLLYYVFILSGARRRD